MSKHKPVHGHGTPKHSLPKNHCFGCGKDNPEGLRLRFVYDEEGRRFLCRFRLSSRYWGPPKHAHGGIVATILDEAMGKVNKIRHVIAVTSEMRVNYLKMVPLGKWLTVESREQNVRGRAHYNVAEIKNDKGEVLARGWAKFLAVDPERMFAKYLKNLNASAPRRTQSK